MVYTFTYLPNKKFLTLEDPSVQSLLRKWSMLGRLTCQAFAFDQEFNAYQMEQFLKDFVRGSARQRPWRWRWPIPYTGKDGIYVYYHHKKYIYIQVLVEEGGELWEVLQKEEREQLLVRLFRLVVLGGECCQFEDNIHHYLAVTRTLYRDLVTPMVEDGRVVVRSVAAQVSVMAADGVTVPEKPTHSQNILLLVVNPHTRTTHTLLHQHGVGDLD
nr:cilia- and flagella-associated protein 300-like [Cherax quadricarinatus]